MRNAIALCLLVFALASNAFAFTPLGANSAQGMFVNHIFSQMHVTPYDCPETMVEELKRAGFVGATCGLFVYAPKTFMRMVDEASVTGNPIAIRDEIAWNYNKAAKVHAKVFFLEGEPNAVSIHFAELEAQKGVGVVLAVEGN